MHLNQRPQGPVKEASGARARERDSHEDQGEASGQVAGDCLDVDEEEGEI